MKLYILDDKLYTKKDFIFILYLSTKCIYNHIYLYIFYFLHIYYIRQITIFYLSNYLLLGVYKYKIILYVYICTIYILYMYIEKEISNKIFYRYI